MHQLAETLLLAVKLNQPVEGKVEALANISLDDLLQQLHDDTSKMAFWINCYNAYFQILRKIQKAEKPEIYRSKLFTIARQQFSLDDIEHGILRKYRYKRSLGYFSNPFTSRLIKNLAVSHIDYRIHFALNCGAVSCPPIAFYHPNNLDQQLDLATASFLDTETTFFDDKKEVHVSRLFQWYLGDFGGKKGIRAILKKYLHRTTKGFKIVFADYSWEEQLDNFINT